MKVIKFGGTSVATSSSLKKVFSIIENEKDSIFVVVSALGDITNILQEFLNSKGKNSTVFLKQIEERHLEIIHGLSKIENQSPLLSFLKQQLNELETILEAVSTIDEITKKTISKVLSFGEILSSKLIFKTADFMWISINDKSTDYNFYTKRAILGTIYSVVILFWLNDKSNKLDKTYNLLEKLIMNMNFISSLKKCLKEKFF